MGRQEFLDGLRTALSGEVSPAVIRDNLNYYEGYISGEIQKGRSEEDVMGELGDPRLIARTIIDTSGGGQSSYQQAGRQSGYYEEESAGASGGTGGDTSRGFRAEFNGNGFNMRYDKPKRPWFEKALIAVVIILAVFLVISMITGLISFLFPILVPLLIIYIIYRIIRGSGGR